ncbi:MAG: hypothetical protein BGO49_24700 [Planctomycetales bacterium 71-10]|nr:MAG: hypothetical protein BGO49_24700 [Planctomycetales bacterium 71-10]
MTPAPETYQQWRDRLAANRKARIAAETDPVERERLEAVDAMCGAVDQFVGRMVCIDMAGEGADRTVEATWRDGKIVAVSQSNN